MPDSRNKKQKKHNSPLIVEIAGLAGAGKTTLARLMSQRYENILIGPEIELRKINHIPAFVLQSPLLLPVLLQRLPASRWYTWDEIKYMTYLNGWTRMLSGLTENRNIVILLDHGPVFKLATLNAFGPERLKHQAAENWWNRMFDQWARTLDIVIWLDAPENVLNDRINNRDQKHAVKGKSEKEAIGFLDLYRESYEQILTSLKTHNQGPAFFQFDTSSNPIEKVLDEVLNICNAHLSETSN
jgi:thymidylate kinase